MPELPDLTIYQEALDARLRGQVLAGIRIANPFILRSVQPGIEDLKGERHPAADRSRQATPCLSFFHPREPGPWAVWSGWYRCAHQLPGRISPMRQIKYLTDDEWDALHRACQQWVQLLRQLPESGKSLGGSQPVAPAEKGLA
jgi:hypothetical protein